MSAASNHRPFFRTRALSALVAVGLAMAAWIAVPSPARAAGFDANAAEQQLFGLINQDRAANGKPALQLNTSLGNIARGGNISVCSGETVHGRSQDMIERNFFAHQIPSCGALVWPAITAAGVQFSSAGENIAWNNYSPQATSVDQVNTAFMNSAGHKANILGDYNQVRSRRLDGERALDRQRRRDRRRDHVHRDLSQRADLESSSPAAIDGACLPLRSERYSPAAGSSGSPERRPGGSPQLQLARWPVPAWERPRRQVPGSPPQITPANLYHRRGGISSVG